MTFLSLVSGLFLLIIGADLLVRGASRMAAAIRISPLVIGLTVVAFGTSSPELAVSIQSAVSGNADIAMGNVVGSNIFNVLFILGLSALITPLMVTEQLVRLDVPIMIGASVLLFIMGIDQHISRMEGVFLVAILIIYISFLIYQPKANAASNKPEDYNETVYRRDGAFRRVLLDIGRVIFGLGLLYFGSKWFVRGAVSIAHHFGVSELIIGLTVIAGGTSLPEAVTSIVAGIRGERDIAVGNIVGSNIFNILGVLGVAAAAVPAGIVVSSLALRIDIPIMIAVAIACLPIFFTGNIIARWEGALFFGYYFAYTFYLILAASRNQALPVFNEAMLYFVIPLTTITLLIFTVRGIHKKRKPHT